MLRKTISVLLALAMVSALTACAGGDGSSESTPAGADPSSAASAAAPPRAEDKTYGKLTISGVTGDPDVYRGGRGKAPGQASGDRGGVYSHAITAPQAGDQNGDFLKRSPQSITGARFNSFYDIARTLT